LRHVKVIQNRGLKRALYWNLLVLPSLMGKCRQLRNRLRGNHWIWVALDLRLFSNTKT
jgi:hypothetical protein